MSTVSVAKAQPVQETARPASDRRRPGRLAFQNTDLIALLRDPAAATADPGADALLTDADGEAPEDDSLSAARGIATGVLLSLGCWTVIGATMWWVCRG